MPDKNDAKDISLSYLKKLRVLLLNPRMSSINSLRIKILCFIKQALKNNEPYLNNVLKYCFSPTIDRDLRNLKETYLFRVQNATKSLNLTNSIIKELAAKKIPKKGVVFVHGDNSLIFEILQFALKEKSFDIYTISSNQLLISKLKRAKIKFQCFPDKAIRIAIKKADIVFLGCRAITPNKIINDLGSELAAEIANNRNIPVYVCTPAMAFTQAYHIPPHKANRSGSTFYHDYNYEQVDPALVTGVISEIGIYAHDSFITVLEREMPWIFTSSFS